MKPMYKKYLKFLFTTVLFLTPLYQQAHAEEMDYSADGERRAKSAGELLVGKPAPDMKITTIDGTVIDLSEVYGKKPVYIKFWATWCIPCREQMPGFEAIYQQYHDQIEVISVNTGINDSVKSVKPFMAKMGLTMPTVIDDGTLARAFQLRVTPQHVLIDKQGLFSYFGHVDDEDFHHQLERAIKQPSVDKVTYASSSAPTTRAYQVGDTLQGLDFTTINDKSIEVKFGHKNSDKVGLVFFGPWCEWYLEETAPESSKACTKVRELLEVKSQSEDMNWVSISTNVWSSVAELHEYKKSYGTSLPIVFDGNGKLFEKFDVNQIPTIILIDKNGRIESKVSVQDSEFEIVLASL
ncbi:redoxin domain-containing protein [Photobacterium ganghwense]|uniref:redoxin domain-containing protein n=1 Tax=Photobacterium ganghwense TaxID=320778 RepID=UPI004056351B